MTRNKTILVLILFVGFSEILAFGTAPAQGNWQWRNDNGSESAATAIASENTSITITDFSNVRIRIELYDANSFLGSGSDTQDYALLYSLDSTNWVQITSDATSNAFALSPSTYFADGDATTSIITNTLSNFQAGSIFELSSSFNYTLNGNSSTQIEYCIKPTDNVQATTRYTFSLGYGSSSSGPFTAFGNSYPTFLTDAAVPVELTSFTAKAKGKGVILNWKTATEVNNYGFDVERASSPLSTSSGNDNSSSVKSSGWVKIGFTPGHGNSNSPKVYSFNDSDPPNGKVEYRLKQIDTDGRFEYSDVVVVEFEKVKELLLGQNFPNPFNPSTTIKYTIPSNVKGEISNVKITIFDILGREVKTLVNKQQQSGNYEVVFNASHLPSGTYIYRLTAGEFSKSKKLILLK